MDKTIRVFAKNKFQDIHVGIKEWKEHILIDIRTWTMTQGTMDMVPTCKGIAINIDLLPKLKEAIEKVEQELKENNYGQG